MVLLLGCDNFSLLSRILWAEGSGSTAQCSEQKQVPRHGRSELISCLYHVLVV